MNTTQTMSERPSLEVPLVPRLRRIGGAGQGQGRGRHHGVSHAYLTSLSGAFDCGEPTPSGAASIGATPCAGAEATAPASAGQLLLKCARLIDEVAMARVDSDAQATGGQRPVLRPAHTRLLPHIEPEGTRMVTLAERLGVTKQAVSQWIAELEEMRVVELLADPDDARAKRVRFTARGLESIHHGMGVLRTIESELAARVGGEAMIALRAALTALAPVLQQMNDSAGVNTAGDETPGI